MADVMGLDTNSSPLTAQTLFKQVFWPLYPPDIRADLEAARDSFVNPANDCGLTELIEEIAEAFKHLAPSMLGIPDRALDDSDASIHRLGAALTRDRRDRLLNELTIGKTRTPLLAMIVIHGTLYVARCIVRNHGGQWLVRRPLWESSVRLRSALGEAELSVFQWWLKSLSDDEVDRCPLGDRYRTYVEVPCFDGQSMPVLGDPRRPIPKLSRPRYDQVIKHLQQHAPAIQSPGPDFPPPDRFASMKLSSLEFRWVGGGRMLLAHGPAPSHGVHLFWLNGDGFLKAAFYPSERPSNYDLTTDGAVLRIALPGKNEPSVHEMPWWGL
jgi:hypothetical protein